MKHFFEIIKWEIEVIFKDASNLLLLLGAALIYSFMYGYLYGPQVVRDMPIAVVDNDGTVFSNDFVRALDANQKVSVLCQPVNMAEAKNLLLQRSIYGIIIIPKDFEKNSLSGQQSNLGVYADGSYFLHQDALVKATTAVTNDFCKRIQMRILEAKGLSEEKASAISQPVKFSVDLLYNSSSAYATSLMPGIMLMIIQQTLLLVIGMILGTQNEFKLWRRLNEYSTWQILFAKIIAYVIAAIPETVYLMWIAYKVLGYPMLENTFDLISLLIPFILSVVCLGISLGSIFNRREASVLYLAPLSVLFLLWSGISWPQESMPTWFYMIGLTIPSSATIKGLVALRTCGADFATVPGYFILLWIQVGIFFVTSYYAVRTARRRSYQ